MRPVSLTLLASLFIFTTNGAAPPELVVHEWGTFTCLQDENGVSIGGINADDEPVPEFVHNAVPNLLPNADPAGSKGGVRPLHSEVTMRLETPVIYFYPSQQFYRHLNVSVGFPSGWLTQYYPDAQMEAVGLKEDGTGRLLGMGRLGWTDISFTASDEGPATSAPVWTIPRQTDSAKIETRGEHEKYLFYRGVGRADAPLRVVRKDPEFIMTRTGFGNAANEIHQVWLVDIRKDGKAALRVLEPFTEETEFLVKTPSLFKPEEYSTDAVTNLRTGMRKALIDAGLFEKEAEAMLDTWQQSYFQSAGLRLFFLVPRSWTDKKLPLHVSPVKENPKAPDVPLNMQLVRVMVGRIELVSPVQRKLLARLAREDERLQMKDGKSEGASMNDAIWQYRYQDYVELGRFRNALVLEEQRRHGGAILSEFVRRFRLEGYTPRHDEPFARLFRR